MNKFLILQLLMWLIYQIWANKTNKSINVIRLGIINGIDVPVGKYPFVVSILKDFTPGKFMHTCTGSILNNKTILTAAHCLLKSNPNSFRIMVGQNHLNNIAPTNLFDVEMIKYNFEFNLDSPTTGNDIGIMKLKTAIDFTKMKNIGSICLASITSVPDSSKCVAIGFGATETSHGKPSKMLKSTILPIQSDSTCRSKFMVDTSRILCAGSGSGTTTCQGDSGGPLVCPLKADPNTILQFGVTSFGGSPCNSSYSYFTNVGGYTTWLKQSAQMLTDEPF